MAADCRTSASERSESDEESECLNIYSKKFDPLKALYSGKMVVPRVDAPAADNLAVLASKIAAMRAGPSVGRAVAASTAPDGLAERNRQRWLPHQQLVKNERPWVMRNILTRMEQETGPIGCLRDAMERKVRIKVVTRNHRGIRGSCIGYLQAFDKQWNLAISDVTELWTRRRKKKVPAGIGDHEDQSLRLPAHVPEVVTKPAGKGVEACERYVPQLLVRGEHVALIVLLSAN